MSTKFISLVAAAGLSFIPATAGAETILRIDTWLSAKHQMNAVVLPTWAKNVEKASNGRIKVRITYPPKTHPKTMFDRVKNGIADVSWSFHGYTPGRFLLTQAVELPGLGASAAEASVAYWRVHQKYFAKANEHKGVKLLAVFSHGPGVLHTRKPITSVEQLVNLKIRTGGGVMGQVADSLKITRVPAPATKVYEILRAGTADGVFMPMETKASLKLKEVAPYSLVLPGGWYYGSFFIIMNQKKYDSLSAADRRAIDSVSGEVLVRMTGKAWHTGDVVGLKAAKAAGNTIATANPALNKALLMKFRAAKIEANWIAKATAKGIDARKALAELRAEVKKLKGRN